MTTRKKKCNPPRYRGFRKSDKKKRCRKKPGPKSKKKKCRYGTRKSGLKKCRKTKPKKKPKKSTQKPKKPTQEIISEDLPPQYTEPLPPAYQVIETPPPSEVTYNTVKQFFMDDNNNILSNSITCQSSIQKNRCIKIFNLLENNPNISLPIKNKNQLNSVLNILLTQTQLNPRIYTRNIIRSCIICLYKTYRQICIQYGIPVDDDVPFDYRN